jgi:hypothetical protein
MLTFARRAGLLEALELRPVAIAPSDTLIVVADGEPDNRVVLALARLLDGRRIADVAFPAEHKHLSALNVVHEYTGRGYSGVVVIPGQEGMELGRVHEEARRRVSLPIESYTVDPGVEGRLAIVRTSGTTVYIVVSGTSDPRFTRHTVEDHLLAVAEALGKHRVRGQVDPKREWSRLPRKTQYEVLSTLARTRELAEEIFRQHIKALAQATRLQEAP